MTASRGMCMMQMHYFHEISRQVASNHRASEKGDSRKLGGTKRARVPNIPGSCLPAANQRLRLHRSYRNTLRVEVAKGAADANESEVVVKPV